MERIDNVIYIAAMQAASQIVDKGNVSVAARVEALPKAFNAMIDAVQKHKDKWANSGNDL